MATITVRSLPEETHRALRVRAAQHGRSTEADVRAILEQAVNPPQRIRIGEALAALARDAGIIAASRGFIVASRDTGPFQAGGLRVINPWEA